MEPRKQHDREIIPQKGTDRPALKYLNRYVKSDIAAEWYNLGLELLDQVDEQKLNEIESNNPGDSAKCAGEMFRFWLSRKPKASWKDLIQALRDVKLDALATKIEEILLPEDSIGLLPSDRKRKQEDDKETDVTAEQPSSSDAKKAKIKDTVNSSTVIDISNSRGGEAATNFAEFENDVFRAFRKLFDIFQREACRATYTEDFPYVKRLCLYSAHENFKPCIKQVEDMKSLFDLLAENTLHCNWIKIGFFEVIASISEILESILKNYEAVFFSKKLKDIWDSRPYRKIRNKYYDKLKAEFDDKDPDDTTVREITDYSKSLLPTDLDDFIMELSRKCLSITWLIPSDKVYYYFLSALTLPQKSRKEDFLQIGVWVVHHPRSVLQKLKMKFAMASPLTLLIGYYHGALLSEIEAEDSLLDDMCSRHLLNSHERSLIAAGNSIHQRNWLLLEHVRHTKEKEVFLEFCELVQSLWPGIGSQLITVSEKISNVQDITTDANEPRVTSHGLQCEVLYIQPSSVHIAFLCLIDQLSESLQCCDVKTLVDRCEKVMASEQQDIKLFSNVQVKKLKEYNDVLMLLHSLNCLFTWSNHSVLRVLLAELSIEVLHLLDDFDSRLDPLQSITSYPVPHFSSSMIPNDTSVYTLLAIRCDQKLYKCTLQYVYNMQLVIIEMCDITQHCLQLLAVRSNPTIFYWTIPTSVVNLINNRVCIPQHSEYLYSRGMLEVLVYPKLVLSTGDDVAMGSLAFKAEIKDNDEEYDDIKELH